MKDLIKATRTYREKMLNDPYRPTYHFAIADDDGRPGDPNGAFFADGIYHLMYLYRNASDEGFHWGHITSTDLLHWRHHKDALGTHNGDGGCFSGGAFLDDDKRAYLTFWKFQAIDGSDNSGIAMAYADPPYEDWYRMEPIAVNGSRWGITDMEIDGEIVHLGNADPSNIWKIDDTYYMQLGNLCVLNEYGRNEDSEEKYKGDWTELYKSKDLKNWEYVHRFYENPHLDEDYPDATEDDMCPSFLPLYDKIEGGKITNKYLQLFIAHNKGTQYYIGELNGEKFIPENHARMSYVDNTYFAPEALIDDKNRHIVWAWLLDNVKDDFNKFGWSGVYAFPRCVWLEDGILKMAPAKELDNLEYNKQLPAVCDDGSFKVNNGEIFRLKATINMENLTKAGFSVKINEEADERTDIYYDAVNKKLVFEAISPDESYTAMKNKEEMPFSLENSENLELDIFADKAVIEVYANNKQAICRRVFTINPQKAVGVKFIGAKENLIKLETFDMAPTNPY